MYHSFGQGIAHDCYEVSPVRGPQPPTQWAYGLRSTEIPLHGLPLLRHAGYERGAAGGTTAARRATPSRTPVPTGDCPDYRYESQHHYQGSQKKIFQPLADTIRPALARPILELDELWSYVAKKTQKVWIWLALERQTRHIVGLACGDRSEVACRALWRSLPPDYRKRALCVTDAWESYRLVLPWKRHRVCAKSSGETSHIERFNNTLRQRCANLVRKTLSFSRDSHLHYTRIRLFIDHYNVTISV